MNRRHAYISGQTKRNGSVVESEVEVSIEKRVPHFNRADVNGKQVSNVKHAACGSESIPLSRRADYIFVNGARFGLGAAPASP